MSGEHVPATNWPQFDITAGRIAASTDILLTADFRLWISNVE
jgi:hypothetical protein